MENINSPADFSKYMKQNKEIQGSVEMGTPGYMAKEMYDGWISYKADIYSIGVTMLEIWFGVLNNYTFDYSHVLQILKK